MQGKTVPGFDKLINFTEVIVSTGYDASATSIVLQAGEGTKLPDPAVYGSYYGVWHDVTAELLASADANREWVLINTVSGDTITSLTRAQQETSASTKNELGHQYRISIVLSAAQMEKYNQLQNNGMSRQALLNSNFNVWSAGTSFSAPVNNSETSDKWKAGFVLATGTFPTIVHSRQALTPGDVLGSFYNYRINTDGAGSSLASTENYNLYQDIINGTRFLAGTGKKITVSFYAKSSIASKKLGINVIQNYGTGGSPTADETITGDNITLTSSWVFYSFTYTLNTLVGKTFGTNNDDYLRLQLWTMWQSGTQSQVGASSAESFGGSGNVEIAQVQVCSGDVALEYRQEDITSEIERIYGVSNIPTPSEVSLVRNTVSSSSGVSDAGKNIKLNAEGEVDGTMINVNVFGDGSDGDVTISADTTLTRDMFYNSLTVNSTKVVTTGGYRIFVKGTLTVNGSIMYNGGTGGTGGNGSTSAADGSQGTNGTAGIAGTGTSTGVVSGGIDGAAGGAGSGVAGSTGSSSSNSIGTSSGSTGGAGGRTGMGGMAAGTGGAGGSVTTKIIPRAFGVAFDTTYNGALLTGNASSGGGGGGSLADSFSGGFTNGRCGGSGGGGGSGGCGGIVPIYARKIIISATGSIEAKGGNGGTGGNGADQSTGSNTRNGGGGGGGGAGGTGGIIILVYKSLTNSGTISSAGGTGGTGGTGGIQTGGLGSSANGFAGSNGSAGNPGNTYQIIL